uniref:Cytochrome P450 n=1 Tax=Steinernema glaseri TaxID=37863 RepID=A0A1I7ZPR0_9BILA
MGVSLWLLGAIVVIFFIYRNALVKWIKERRRLISVMEKMDGPLSFPIIGTAWMFKMKIEDFSDQLQEWGLYYINQGKTLARFWIGTSPMVAVLSPESAKVVLESRDIITKGPEYNILIPWLGTGLLISTGAKWHSRRKLLTPAFHFSILHAFLKVHDSESKIMIDQLEKYAQSGEDFDIFPYIKRCALDIICETSMGRKVDAQMNHNHPYVSAVQRMNELAFCHERMPWLWLKPVWYGLGYGGEYDRNLKLLTDFSRKVIKERSEEYESRKHKDATGEGKQKQALLDLLLGVKEQGQLTYEDIREEVDTFMFEGHDTTSSGMGWTLWCLAHNPEVQEKAIAEIDAIFEKSDRECTNEDLTKMKYLEMCIKEAMRLFPPVPNFSRVATEDFECDGYLIPKGATVIISAIIIHRNPKIYKDPLKYNPDNFLPENVASRHPFAYVPFSAGPRNCIGQKFALMEEKTVLSRFLRNYTIKASMPFESNKPCPEIIMKPLNGFHVSIQSRKKEEIQ